MAAPAACPSQNPLLKLIAMILSQNLVGSIQDWTAVIHADGVDEYIQAAEALARLVHSVAARARRGEIGRDGKNAAAASILGGCHRGETGLVDVEHGHVGARIRKRAREAGADSAGTGDHRTAPGQSQPTRHI